MRIIFRPFISWPGEPTRYRKASPFSSTYPATLELLERELNMLGAREAVLQLDLTEAEIRTDGRPRANARPAHPGVVLSVETRYGALQYATDVFDHWQDNLRAIALSLEALRRVDRYGVARRGEQYTGWRALPAGDGTTTTDPRTAAEFIITAAGYDVDEWNVKAVLDGSQLQPAYRLAARRLHPDQGGSPEDFALLQAAKRVLDEAVR